jgi:hypothetical protein
MMIVMLFCGQFLLLSRQAAAYVLKAFYLLLARSPNAKKNLRNNFSHTDCRLLLLLPHLMS